MVSEMMLKSCLDEIDRQVAAATLIKQAREAARADKAAGVGERVSSVRPRVLRRRLLDRFVVPPGRRAA